MRKILLIIKSFRKRPPHFFPNKVLSTKIIILIENEKIIANNTEAANIMNSFF